MEGVMGWRLRRRRRIKVGAVCICIAYTVVVGAVMLCI